MPSIAEESKSRVGLRQRKRSRNPACAGWAAERANLIRQRLSPIWVLGNPRAEPNQRDLERP